MSGSNGNPYAGLGLNDFVAAAQRLLLRGLAWTRDPASTLTKLITAIAASFARLQAAISNLTEVESDPTQAVQLLPDWEQAYGLPDPCSPPGATIAQRQAALGAKMKAQGGASIAYFNEVAASLGYSGTSITEYRPAQYGVSHYGDLFYDDNWGGTWQMNVPAADPPTQQLSCVLNRIKPAGTNLVIATVG